MSDIYFSNFALEDDTDYFLYIGELKNYGLNSFLQEALSRIFNRRFKFIAIVPDIFEQYHYENLIVINPQANDLECRLGSKVCCRISARQFMQCVSTNPKIQALVKQLRHRQDNVFLYMYESLPEMSLDDLPGVSILGPGKMVAHRINNKVYQYERLADLVPIVEFRVCQGISKVLATCEDLWGPWSDGIFVTQPYSAAGANAIVARDAETISARFADDDQPYLITRYIPHEFDPTVLAVVAGEEDVFIAGVADQRIEGGSRFTGSTFPSVLPAKVIDELEAHTRTIGQWLAREGYRGIYGCDYLVDAGGDVRFLEINARKQGTTLEFCCTLEQLLPAGAPVLPELEYYAVQEGILPANTATLRGSEAPFCWGTYNYKLADSVRTNGYIPHDIFEREAFRKVARGELKKHYLILEHTGSDFVVAEGSFIGRVVALGHDHPSVAQGLQQGKNTIELTIARDKGSEKTNG